MRISNEEAIEIAKGVRLCYQDSSSSFPVKPEDVKAIADAIVSTCNRKTDELCQQLATAKQAIEADRTKIADAVTKLTKEIQSRAWLLDGRGSYEWDDDRYRKEFDGARKAILEAVEPLKRMAADLSNSPRTADEVIQARRDLLKEIEELKAKRSLTLHGIELTAEHLERILCKLAEFTGVHGTLDDQVAAIERMSERFKK